MSNFEKFGRVEKQAAQPEQLEKINRLTLRELTSEEVFCFRILASDDQPDRDFERFTAKTLGQLAEMFIGKTMIMDHKWSAENQTARIFDGCTREVDGVTQLILSAYMLRNEQTAATVAAIEGGILKEVSVGCAVSRAVCNICGTDKTRAFCEHRPGGEYEGKTCIIALEDATDAYELSFCAVPAKPEAGVVKAYGGEKNRQTSKEEAELNRRKALALLELEEI